MSTPGSAISPVQRPALRRRARENREQVRARIIAAATDLVRERSYAELSVGAIMASAGIGRTLFYRHFDDLGDLLIRATREAIEELYEAVLELGKERDLADPAAVAAGIEAAAGVYRRHGPLLRALAEAAPGDERIAAGRARIRAQFDELVARSVDRDSGPDGPPSAEALERARALNLMNEGYLLDAFGSEPRIDVETAARTLTQIWVAVTSGQSGKAEAEGG